MVKKILILIQTKEKNVANSFKKYGFKLMNNSTLSKTTENLRKIINVRLFNNAKDYKKLYAHQILFYRGYLVKFCYYL